MDSWFREIHVPRAWHVHLATGFDFHEKTLLVLDRSESLRWLQSPTLSLYYEGR